MKTWKHFIIATILGIVGIVIGFTACDDGKNPQDDPNEEKDRPTTIILFGNTITLYSRIYRHGGLD